MSWVVCFVLWFLGAYASAVAIDDHYDWGPTRIALAVIFWPRLITWMLLMSFVQWLLSRCRRLKDGW